MPDVLLIFPPQWSPFQPPLSLPSLAAWLRRAGFAVRAIDLNVRLYEWLITDECARLLLNHVEASGWSADERLAYRTVLAGVGDHRADLAELRTARVDAPSDPAEKRVYVERHYRAVSSLETYLRACSTICGSFTISPYEFKLRGGDLETAQLERQLAEPPELLDTFVQRAVEAEVAPHAPKVVGISCIGQEQLYLTLLLGRHLKRALDVPVIVGGTIFSRIFERGALEPEWFGRYFDVIVRNEGERPTERMLANVRAGRPLTAEVPGVVHCRDGVLNYSVPAPPLQTTELPTPDFDDLPLDSYISAEVTLPLLTARGCYWGKCEFCHHGMVYGERYQAYEISHVLDNVEALAAKHGVRHFAFNDEAIPPKVLRAMGRAFPSHAERGWTFTGLIKFEKGYQREDFERAHAVGLRSLYVGLESASERVLDLMRKQNTKDTIARNLQDATGAGIWMHCFLFFGFPGETESDARETYDFVIDNADIISSFGTATFVLEHNAPIFHHHGDFGLRLAPQEAGKVDVYYEFQVTDGITPERAHAWKRALDEAALEIPGYNAAGWVPRELQLCMLSAMTPEELVDSGLAIRRHSGLPQSAPLSAVASWKDDPAARRCIVVNRLNGRVLALTDEAASLFRLCHEHGVTVEQVREWAPPLHGALALHEERLGSEAVMSPVPAPQ